MRVLGIVMLSFFPVVFGVSSKGSAPQTTVTPLTLEQIAVYRGFLRGYNNGSKKLVNLSNKTGPLQPDEGDYTGCMKDFPHGAKAMEVHQLQPSLEQAGAIHLVDATQHHIADPEYALPNRASIEEAERKASAGGLLSVSEIIFDGSHKHAALSYSFVCGSLCGNGGIVIMDLTAGKWSQSRLRCGSWIS